MTGIKSEIIAGIGCRRGATTADIAAAVEAAFIHSGQDRHALAAFATGASKADEPAIAAIAAAYGVALHIVPHEQLDAAASRAITCSPRVLVQLGLPSLAETAALAVAGPTARLLGPRAAVGGATCALAQARTP
ncbi:MAG TPA: cobalamin biosynthesis protein [Stellaceae bacterium]|nr:cobalamin biosynthesis protein [Stellaceae bacterium]